MSSTSLPSAARRWAASPSSSKVPLRTEAFRPKLPFDPFADADRTKPWFINPVHLNFFHGKPNQVFLVLGSPSHHDLAPLLHTSHLYNAFLLIATHSPPQFHSSPPSSCSVVILRTLSPLDTHQAGAVRLVSVLQRAERIASRRHKITGQLVQFSENGPDGDFTVPEPFGHNPSSSVLPSLPEGTLPAFPESMTKGAADPSSHSVFSKLSRKSSKKSRKKSSFNSSPQRTFDAIINYIPPNLSEKAVFKLTVLVTTLSHPFLSSSSSAPTSYHSDSRPASLSPSPASSRPASRPASFVEESSGQNARRHLSFLSSSSSHPGSSRSLPMSFISRKQSPVTPSSVRSAPPTPRMSQLYASYVQQSQNAHIIHVFPDTYVNTTGNKSRLMTKIEEFLVSFAYPHLRPFTELSRPASIASNSSQSSLSSRSSIYSIPEKIVPLDKLDVEKPVPFLLSTKVFGSTPRGRGSEEGNNHTIAECILLGAMDLYDDGQNRNSKLLDNLMNGGARAWIQSSRDVVFGTDDLEGSSPGLDEKSSVLTGEAEGSSMQDGAASSIPRVTVMSQGALAKPQYSPPAMADAKALGVSSLPTPPDSTEGSGASTEETGEDGVYGLQQTKSEPVMAFPAPVTTGGTRTGSLSNGDGAKLGGSAQRKAGLASRLRFWKS